MYRLEYYIHDKLINQWGFKSFALCKWKKRELQRGGDCLMGHFKIVRL